MKKNNNEKKADKEILSKNASSGNEGRVDGKRFLKYLLLLVLAAAVGIVAACFIFFSSDGKDRYATASIELNYDGAAQNMTPNGEKFSIASMTGDSVIGAALKKLGLEETYSVTDVQKSCVVNPYYPEDILDRIRDYDSLFDFETSRQVLMEEYYPTIYTLNVYDDFDPSVSEKVLSDLCYEIVCGFKQDMIEKNRYSYDTTDMDSIIVIDKYDYSQQVKIISGRTEQLKAYADGLAQKASAFRYNGMGFRDIYQKCDDLLNNGINKVNAFISLNALAISPGLLRNQYNYDLTILNSELKNAETSLEQLDRLIDSYQMDDILYIGSGDILTKIESNSTKTYDELINRRQKLTENIADISSRIETLQLSLEDMKAADSSSPLKEEAEMKLTGVCGQLVVLEDTFREMIASYNDTLISDADIDISDYEINSPKILSGAFVKQVVKCSGPLVLLVLMGCLIHCIICERRKLKF